MNDETTRPDGQQENVLPDPKTLTYEQAKVELQGIVQALETGSVQLEQTLTLWQRGEALAAHCKSILDAATALIEQSENADVVEE